jgi:hypothetical protein
MIEILPATPDRWADLEDLFGPERGGCAGCWCVWPRVSAGEFKALGARAVEACTIDPDRPLIWGDGFVGLTPVFDSLGFEEVARRSPRRPLMRLMT